METLVSQSQDINDNNNNNHHHHHHHHHHAFVLKSTKFLFLVFLRKKEVEFIKMFTTFKHDMYIPAAIVCPVVLYFKMEQGWCSGERTRLPPMWRGFDSQTWCHMWVEFVVGSISSLLRGFFPGTLIFPPQKPTCPNSNSTWDTRSPLNKFVEISLVLVGKQITFTFK